MPTYYQSPHVYGNGQSVTSPRRRPLGPRKHNANDTSHAHHHHSTAGTNSIHTLHSGKLTSTYHRTTHRHKRVTTTTYSPLFSVHYTRRYNSDTGEYEVSHVTRTVNPHYASSGREQIAASILSAMKTKQVVRSFRHDVDTRGYDISVQVPTETSMRITDGKTTGTVVVEGQGTYVVPALTEPYLPDTQTIMCNSGWTTDDREGTAQKLLLALPHYSYMWSGREYMIGSLQASIDTEHRRITIRAPTLMSRRGNTYGSEDIGMKGICNYFYWHPSSRLVPQFVKPSGTSYNHEPSPQNLVHSRG